MENSGWIKLHRKFLESPLWKYAIRTKYPILISFWMYLLISVNWEEKKWYDGKAEIIIPPGSIITSQISLAEYFGVSRQTIRTCLLHLENMKMITSSTTNKWTQVWIVNWAKYQMKDNSNNQRLDNKPTNEPPTTNQRVDTTKEDKNIRSKEDMLTHIQKDEITNKLSINRSQHLLYLKEFQGLTTSELKEQITLCNSHMVFSSSNYSNPGLYFRGWLKKYMQEKRTREAEQERLKETLVSAPEISEEQKQINIERIAEIKKKLIKTF